MSQIYPLNYIEFGKRMNVGNYPILYALMDDYIYIEMPIDYCTFATKRFFSSIKEKAQLGLDNDNKLALLKLFLKTELSGKTYVQFYPNAEKEKEIEDMKTYDKLFVREAHADIEYKPELATKKEDDLYVYLYHLDKLVYKLEKE